MSATLHDLRKRSEPLAWDYGGTEADAETGPTSTMWPADILAVDDLARWEADHAAPQRRIVCEVNDTHENFLRESYCPAPFEPRDEDSAYWVGAWIAIALAVLTVIGLLLGYGPKP